MWYAEQRNYLATVTLYVPPWSYFCAAAQMLKITLFLPNHSRCPEWCAERLLAAQRHTLFCHITGAQKDEDTLFCQITAAEQNDARRDYSLHNDIHCFAISQHRCMRIKIHCFAKSHQRCQVWVIWQNNISSKNCWYIEQKLFLWLNFTLDSRRKLLVTLRQRILRNDSTGEKREQF